jgi:two-component system phosphate regulon response regulator PhoB
MRHRIAGRRSRTNDSLMSSHSGRLWKHRGLAIHPSVPVFVDEAAFAESMEHPLANETSATSGVVSGTPPGMSHRVLLLHQNMDALASMAFQLTKRGYRVTTATVIQEAAHAIRTEIPEMIVARTNQDRAGIEFVRRIRETPGGMGVGIVLLCEHTDARMRLDALTAGVDDVMDVPVGVQEFLLRIATLSRRVSRTERTSGVTTAGPLTLDVHARRVTVDGNDVHLSRLEFSVLQVLIERCGRLVTRNELLSIIWTDHDVTPRALDVRISQIRKKLGDVGDVIETVRGEGYILRLP